MIGVGLAYLHYDVDKGATVDKNKTLLVNLQRYLYRNSPCPQGKRSMNRDTKSSAKRIPMSGSRDTTTLESPAGDEEATIVDNETKSIKGPPEKKRKFEVTEDDPLKRQIGDPFSSPEEADRKRPALDQHPTAPFEQPGSMQYQGTETFDTQAKGIFAPKNLDQESKDLLQQSQEISVAVAASASRSQIAMAPSMSATSSNPPPALAMPPPPPQPLQSQQHQHFLPMGNINPFQNQLAAYQAGLVGLPPQFLQQQLLSSAILPQFAGMTAGTAMSPNFQPIDLSSPLRMQAAAALATVQTPLSAQDAAELSGKPPQPLFMSCDVDSLSEYQCLVRKQIELFEARPEDVASNAKGRNKPIVIGQVGIRCRHCRLLPPKSRQRGATYYPAKLNGLYQAAQSMASGHLCNHCGHIPQSIRQELNILRERKSSAGGGKKYWGDGVRVLGVYEDETGLRFRKEQK